MQVDAQEAGLGRLADWASREEVGESLLLGVGESLLHAPCSFRRFLIPEALADLRTALCSSLSAARRSRALLASRACLLAVRGMLRSDKGWRVEFGEVTDAFQIAGSANV